MSKDDMFGIVVRKLETLPEDVLGIAYKLLEKLSDPEGIMASKRFLHKEDSCLAVKLQTAERQDYSIPVVIPIMDDDLPERYRAIGAAYRQLASEHGLSAQVPICYLYGGIYVFWVPRILQGSTSNGLGEQRKLIQETRTKLGLPDNHVNCLGKLALVTNLMHAHLMTTGERILLTVRTDSCDADGRRTCLSWHEGDLLPSYWGHDDKPWGAVGVLFLGMELGN